jgi:hypothetical protein
MDRPEKPVARRGLRRVPGADRIELIGRIIVPDER